MSKNKEIFKENLVIQLGGLLSKEIFWGTESHYQRQKSFTLSNNFFAHQVTSSIKEYSSLLKKELKELEKTSSEICGLYLKYETPIKNVNILDLFNQNIENISKLNKDMLLGLNKISKELDSPDPENGHNYTKMYSVISNVSQEIITAADLAFDVSEQLKLTSKGLKNDIQELKKLAHLGEIKKTNKVKNFLTGKKSENQEIINTKISQKKQKNLKGV